MTNGSSSTCVANCPEILLQASCRNVPLELQYLNPDRALDRIEPDVLYAQTRLLGVDEEYVYLDSPQDIGKQVRIGGGRQVQAFLNWQGKSYTFRAKVAKLRCLVELNRRKTVVGMCLFTPRSVWEQQRRQDHRVSVAALDPIEVALHETADQPAGCCPIAARRFRGRIVNLSRGGLAMRLRNSDRYEIHVPKWYYLTFSLPDPGEELLFLAEARHVQEILGGHAGIAGFQFLRWPNPTEMRRKEACLGRFIVEVERRALRNRRAR